MNTRLLICIALYAVVMWGVYLAAHGIDAQFGILGSLVTIAAMYGAARWYDHRERRR